MAEQDSGAGKADTKNLLKVVLDAAPLVIFFGTYYWAKSADDAAGVTRIIYATGALMIATVLSLAGSYVLLKRIAVMPLVTGVFVLIFGGLTVYLQDPSFIKIKPTIIYLIFASFLVGGLFFRKLLLKHVLGEVLEMQDEGWRQLTLRMAGFFVFLAGANEIVRREFSDGVWVAFKAFGLAGLMLLFLASQISLIMRYRLGHVSSDETNASST